MNIKRIEDKLKIEDFKDVIPEEKKEEVINFLEKNIINNVLMSIIGNIKQDRRYDFIYSKKIVETCMPYLKEKESFFSEKNKEALKDIENICVIVEEENYSEEYINEKVKEDEIDFLMIVPTYIAYDEYYPRFEKETGIKDWGITTKIYKVIEDFYRSLDYDGLIQIGGYVIWPIQAGYDNLIGYYYGEYGDCGAVYVYLDNNKITSTVDMH